MPWVPYPSLPFAKGGRGYPAAALQALKQQTSRKLKQTAETQLRQRRYDDSDIWSRDKTVEKLRYVHRNQIRRSQAATAEYWPWSSFRHEFTGLERTFEIESHWTVWQCE